jgi:hypothetical protein
VTEILIPIIYNLLHLDCFLQMTQLAVPADCWECLVHPPISLKLGAQSLPILDISEASGKYF